MPAMDLLLFEMELESIRNLSGDNLTAKYQELPSDKLPGQEEKRKIRKCNI